MSEADVEEFDKFVEKQWGTKLSEKETVEVSATVENKSKRRGRKPKTTQA